MLSFILNEISYWLGPFALLNAETLVSVAYVSFDPGAKLQS